MHQIQTHRVWILESAVAPPARRLPKSDRVIIPSRCENHRRLTHFDLLFQSSTTTQIRGKKTERQTINESFYLSKKKICRRKRNRWVPINTEISFLNLRMVRKTSIRRWIFYPEIQNPRKVRWVFCDYKTLDSSWERKVKFKNRTWDDGME